MAIISIQIFDEAINRLNDFQPPCRGTNDCEKEIFSWGRSLKVTYRDGFYTATISRNEIEKTVRTPYKGRIRTALQSWKAL